MPNRVPQVQYFYKMAIVVADGCGNDDLKGRGIVGIMPAEWLNAEITGGIRRAGTEPVQDRPRLGPYSSPRTRVSALDERGSWKKPIDSKGSGK
jgi:hypothetical protein